MKTLLPLLRWVTIGLLLLAMMATVRIAYAETTVECAATVTVQPGDTLSLIAARQSGSQVNYQAIVAATNAKATVDSAFTAIANPNVLSVGWKLCIPGNSAESIASRGDAGARSCRGPDGYRNAVGLAKATDVKPGA